jgi:polysaccharide export outer membrane protein
MKVNKIKALSSILVVFLFLHVSCISNKKFVYMQSNNGVKIDSNQVMKVESPEYKLQVGDILFIALSTEDERLNRIFVPGSGGGQVMQQNPGVIGTNFYFIGFTIDKNGEIEFPYLGKIKVIGLEVFEAKLEIESKLKKYFKEFFLQVKVAEFKFSILGFINSPGQYFFQTNKVTVLDAIAQAGDLQNLADRKRIQLYRQYPSGVKLHEIDITNSELINSPYWYLQPGDMIYVRPLKMRAAGDMTNFQSSMAVITPLLSTLLLVLNTYILVVNLK